MMWAGELCCSKLPTLPPQTNIDDCQADSCANGGTCIDGINEFSCQCTKFWNGDRCQNDINECDSSPCQNGGKCINTVGSSEPSNLFR